jgi:hypothetical protein
MTRIIADISVSLDDVAAGPDPGPERDLDVDRDAPDPRRLPVIR